MKIKAFFQRLLTADGHEELRVPDTSAEFALLFDEQPVGVLSLEDGIWEFKYSRSFRHQDQLKPLHEFPDINKVYRSEALWPFFSFRIPGLNQPHVMEQVKENEIEKDNVVDLLKLFGQKSINNPFELEAVK